MKCMCNRWYSVLLSMILVILIVACARENTIGSTVGTDNVITATIKTTAGDPAVGANVSLYSYISSESSIAAKRIRIAIAEVESPLLNAVVDMNGMINVIVPDSGSYFMVVEHAIPGGAEAIWLDSVKSVSTEIASVSQEVSLKSAYPLEIFFEDVHTAQLLLSGNPLVYSAQQNGFIRVPLVPSDTYTITITLHDSFGKEKLFVLNNMVMDSISTLPDTLSIEQLQSLTEESVSSVASPVKQGFESSNLSVVSVNGISSSVQRLSSSQEINLSSNGILESSSVNEKVSTFSNGIIESSSEVFSGAPGLSSSTMEVVSSITIQESSVNIIASSVDVVSSVEETLSSSSVVVNRLGMTWKVFDTNDSLGITQVVCDRAGTCDPYIGDTHCSKALPILCIKQSGIPRPAYSVNQLAINIFSWSEGEIQITDSIVGGQIRSSNHADTLCEQQFGVGYELAEYHMGQYIVGMSDSTFADSAWTNTAGKQQGDVGFFAQGIIPTDTLRFWAYINDQPAHCWDE